MSIRGGADVSYFLGTSNQVSVSTHGVEASIDKISGIGAEAGIAVVGKIPNPVVDGEPTDAVSAQFGPVGLGLSYYKQPVHLLNVFGGDFGINMPVPTEIEFSGGITSGLEFKRWTKDVALSSNLARASVDWDGNVETNANGIKRLVKKITP